MATTANGTTSAAWPALISTAAAVDPGPVQGLYSPPQHSRDPQAMEIALAAYETALAEFDRETGQNGGQNVTAHHNFWHWPNPA
jgi:hypothetical protein